MNNFPKSLAEARMYLANLRPWAVIAAIAALVVVGFYTMEGWRYWNAWDESKTMTAEIQQINAKLDQGTPQMEGSEEALSLQKQRLSHFEEMFGQRDVSRLIGIVSNTSRDSGVQLPSITTSDPVFEEEGETRFLTQSLNIVANGDTEDIYRFLSNLQEELPILSVPNISISQPGQDSTAQIQLTLYLLPEETSEEEAAD